MSHTGMLESTPTIPGETVSRVALTPAAVELLQQLAATHGPLMFHQSGGCCDGSAPMCYPAGEFMTGDADVLLGVFELPGQPGPDGTPGEPSPLEFWMSREQFRYWAHTRLTVDVVVGRGSGFSLEAPEGKRFLIRSELVDFGAETGAEAGGDAAPGHAAPGPAAPGAVAGPGSAP